MLAYRMQITGCVAVFAALLGAPEGGLSQTSQFRVEAAVKNIMTLHRPGQDGLATVWDGNKYVQCRWMPDRTLRCEAGGTLMQPPLARILRPERIARLAALGWQLDTSFGNYVQVFPGGLPGSQVADKILQALKDGYDADLTNLEIQTDWIKSSPCPPRNGPSQNLAGMINDHPAMASTAVYGCAYKPGPGDEPAPLVRAAGDLIIIYGSRVSGELQRLRVNADRQVFVVLQTDAGYVQCAPLTSPRGIYCEAQSAESWSVLAHILTADRVARLHAAGFSVPGRSPNYWKTYPAGQFSDAAIADELLTILHDVYGYNGSPKLRFKSEKGRH
jgi:hypothetical protein